MDAHPTTGKGGAIDTCDNPGHGTRGVGARLGFLERKRPAGPIYTSAAKTRRAPDLVGPSGVWRLCGSGFIPTAFFRTTPPSSGFSIHNKL
jgi:hypothetical protein